MKTLVVLNHFEAISETEVVDFGAEGSIGVEMGLEMIGEGMIMDLGGETDSDGKEVRKTFSEVLCYINVNYNEIKLSMKSKTYSS